MNTVKRIAKNTGVLFVSKIATTILGFFYIMYTARYLGVEGFGVLSFALAFTGIFVVFTDLGLSILTVRDVSRDKSLASKYLGNIVVMKIIFAAITFVLIASTINLLSYPEQTIKVVNFITLSIIISAFSETFYSIFRAYEKMEYQSYGQILNSILMLAGILFAINKGFNVIGLASIYFLVSIIIFVYSYLFCTWKFVKPVYTIDLNFWKSKIKDALPFSLTVIIAGLFFRIDITMLSAMKGDEVAGLYNAACTIILIIVSIADVFIFAVFPVASKYFVSSKDSLIFVLEKSSKYLFIIGLPMALGAILLADKIILLIYGSEFAEAALVIRVLGLYVPLRFISHSTGWMLASINREPLRTLSAGITIGINIILNIILIPKLGIIGAGIATVISQTILFTLYFYFVARFFHRLPLHKMLVKPCISSLVMGIFILHFIQSNIFLIIALSIIIYFGVLYLIKAFDTDDKKMFGEIVSGFTS